MFNRVVVYAIVLSIAAAAWAQQDSRKTDSPVVRAEPKLLQEVRVGDVKVFYPDLERNPKGLAGVGLKAEDVNRAIQKGRDYLWGYLWKEVLQEGKRELSSREDLLACLALVHSGAHEKIPEFDARLRNFLERLSIQGFTNYQFGILAMLTEGYGNAQFYGHLRHATRYVVESQGPQGVWAYNGAGDAAIKSRLAELRDHTVLKVYGGRELSRDDPTNFFRREMPAAVGLDGDNSVSQFAVLGLWGASRAGLCVDKPVWQACLDQTRKRQGPDGGWCYDSGSTSYGSMTCAGICTSAICQHYLGRDPLTDPSIHKGLAWLIQNWDLTRNPKASEWQYYYLYSLERVGRILGIEFIGPREWYPLGARYLVDQQGANGAWREPGTQDPRLTCSFALLFLTRATWSLEEQKWPDDKPGQLRAAMRPAPGNRYYFILDCSATMGEMRGGKRKLDAACDALEGILKELPPNSLVALRVYGLFRDSSTTVLAIPMGPLNREAFVTMIRARRPFGETPMARSLAAARDDLASLKVSWQDPVVVILLTDGGENDTPPQDPVAATRALFWSKRDGMRFHIVGFDIGNAEWTRQLQQMGAAAWGWYWPAKDVNSLQKELRAAIRQTPDTFSVLDPSGEAVNDADGKPVKDRPFAPDGSVTSIRLPKGQYVFSTRYMKTPFLEPFWVRPGRPTDMVFDSNALWAWSCRPLFVGSARWDLPKWQDKDMGPEHPMRNACSLLKTLPTKNQPSICGVGFGPPAKDSGDRRYFMFKTAHANLLAKAAEGTPNFTQTRESQEEVNGLIFDKVRAFFRTGKTVSVCTTVQDGRCVAYWFLGTPSDYPAMQEGMGKAVFQETTTPAPR